MEVRGRASFSMALSSCGVEKPCSVSSSLTCSMGSREVRIALMSSRVRYVVPGSLIECPWYLRRQQVLQQLTGGSTPVRSQLGAPQMTRQTSQDALRKGLVDLPVCVHLEDDGAMFQHVLFGKPCGVLDGQHIHACITSSSLHKTLVVMLPGHASITGDQQLHGHYIQKEFVPRLADNCRNAPSTQSPGM